MCSMASTYDATAISLPESFARACRMTGPIEVRATHRPTGAETAHAVETPLILLVNLNWQLAHLLKAA